jgi:hypothetical protein
VIACAMLVTTSQLCAQELRHFDPDILGKSIEEPVQLLLPGDPNAIMPIGIKTDVMKGKYLGSTSLLT